MVLTQAIDTDIQSMNAGATTITSRLVESEFEHWVNTLEGFAGLPVIVKSVVTLDHLSKNHPFPHFSKEWFYQFDSLKHPSVLRWNKRPSRNT
jgi:hypothetical protein